MTFTHLLQPGSDHDSVSFDFQEDSDHASQWQATFDKTVAAYKRNLSQHGTGLLADFYLYDEDHYVYDAATKWVYETDNDKDYFTNASRLATILNELRHGNCTCLWLLRLPIC